MGYMEELRQLIGKRPIIGVGATILVFNLNREILLQLRSDTNSWGLPGGGMEAGEKIEETAKRELFEECGLTLEESKLLTVLSGSEYYFVYPNGDELHTVIVLFEALKVSGELSINDDESNELRYFNLSFLPILESRAQAVIRWYQRNIAQN
jgi:8-oxo-dGTP pyrophosphatase MutT (NUDIX family)